MYVMFTCLTISESVSVSLLLLPATAGVRAPTPRSGESVDARRSSDQVVGLSIFVALLESNFKAQKIIKTINNNFDIALVKF